MVTYLVTGTNRGIGYEYCQQLQARDDTVIAVCRSSAPALDALGIQVETGVDITDEQSVANLAERLQGVGLDVLINNAGIIQRITLNNLDFDSIRLGSIDDNTSGGSYGYRMSKVTLSMAGKSLAHDLKPDGIAVEILHPGLVQTRMTGFTSNGITPTEPVQGS